MKEEKEYRFYGWRSADVSPVIILIPTSHFQITARWQTRKRML